MTPGVYRGQIYLLPWEQRADKDDRPHIVLSSGNNRGGVVTMAYCSTQPTEANLGAQHVLVEPGSEGFQATGLKEATYIYPSRLVVIDLDELVTYRKIGMLSGPQLMALRFIALPRALGIGDGTCRDPGVSVGSLRGGILQFSPAGRDRVGAAYALVTTNPVFSRQHESLNVVPIADGDRVESQFPDLMFEGQDWIAPLKGLRRVVLFTRLVQAIRRQPDVSRLLPPHADTETMRQVDLALRAHFLTPEEIANGPAKTSPETP